MCVCFLFVCLLLFFFCFKLIPVKRFHKRWKPSDIPTEMIGKFLYHLSKQFLVSRRGLVRFRTLDAFRIATATDCFQRFEYYTVRHFFFETIVADKTENGMHHGERSVPTSPVLHQLTSRCKQEKFNVTLTKPVQLSPTVVYLRVSVKKQK